MAAFTLALFAAIPAANAIELSAQIGYVPWKGTGDLGNQALRECFDNYLQNHPGVGIYEFERIWLPGMQWGASQVMSVAGTAGPDILALNQAELGGYVREGLIQPVDDLFEGWLEKGRTPKSLIEGLKLEGQNWGVVEWADYAMLVASREAFSAAKMGESNMPTTWAELGKVCARLTIPGKRAGLAFQSPARVAALWIALAWQAGGEEPVKIGSDGLIANLSTESSRKAAQALADLGAALRAGGPDALMVAKTEAEIYSAFTDGRIAVVVGGTSLVNDRPEKKGLAPLLPYLAPVPGCFNAEPLAYAPEVGLGVIPSYIRDGFRRKLIWEFLTTAREAGSDYDRAMLRLFAANNAYKIPLDFGVRYPGHPAVAWMPKGWPTAVARAMQAARPTPPDGEWTTLATILGDQLVALMREGGDPADFLRKAQDRFDEDAHNLSRHQGGKWKFIGWGVIGVVAALLLYGLFRLVWTFKDELVAYRSAPMQRMNGSKWGIAIALFMPALAISIMFGVVPLLMGLKMSMFTHVLRDGGVFAGFHNFYDVAVNPLTQKAVLNTFYFMFYSFFLAFLAPLVLALALASFPRGAFIVRTAFFFPAVASTVVVTVLWQQMYASNGAFNTLVKLLGFPPRDWLAEPGVAMFATVLPQAWSTLGVSGLIYLAGLSAIPENLYEDAEISGAGVVERFRNITFPYLRPLIGISLVGWILSVTRTAEHVFLLTAGGPNNTTYVIGLDIFNQAYVYIKFGYAMAEVWLLVAVILVLSIYQMRAIRTGQLKVMGE